MSTILSKLARKSASKQCYNHGMPTSKSGTTLAVTANSYPRAIQDGDPRHDDIKDSLSAVIDICVPPSYNMVPMGTTTDKSGNQNTIIPSTIWRFAANMFSLNCEAMIMGFRKTST